MLTIGKTSEGNHIFLTITPWSFARTGKQELSLASMMRDVFYKQHVSSVMDGRNKSTIL